MTLLRLKKQPVGSGRPVYCCKCGRLLENEESKRKGIGPVCEKNVQLQALGSHRGELPRTLDTFFQGGLEGVQDHIK